MDDLMARTWLYNHSDIGNDVLPDDVRSNIGHAPAPGEPRDSRHARAALAETCRAVGGRPISLHHTSALSTRPWRSTTTTASTLLLPDGRPIVFETRRESARAATTWTISINGDPLVAEDRARPPTPAAIALIVARAAKVEIPKTAPPRRTSAITNRAAPATKQNGPGRSPDRG